MTIIWHKIQQNMAFFVESSHEIITIQFLMKNCIGIMYHMIWFCFSKKYLPSESSKKNFVFFEKLESNIFIVQICRKINDLMIKIGN